MAILDSISQRRRDVTFSGNSLYSVIWIHNPLRLETKFHSGPGDRLLSVRKKVNMVHGFIGFMEGTTTPVAKTRRRITPFRREIFTDKRVPIDR